MSRPEGRSRIVVLHLTSMWSTKYGGLEAYFVELARQCFAKGHPSVLQYNRTAESARYIRELTAGGGETIVVPLDQGRLSGAVRALRLIAGLRPDVVHVHFLQLPTMLIVGLFSHRLGVRRVVATVHAVPTFRSRGLARVAYSRMDRVLCVSRAVTAAVAAIGVPGEFLFTHYLGVPLGMTPLNDARSSIRQDLSIADDASIMLTVGFPTPVKGIDVVVDAFLDHLAESFPSLHLVIVGVRPYQRALASVRADRLPGRIHWVGIQDDVWRYMTAADVYIQASRSEALGLAILEAMARGVPVVGTSVGGIPEVILDGENGLLVPPASPAELAHAVTRLLNDEALRARFARAGRETCEHRFDIVQSAQALVEDHYQFGPSARMRLA